jgi:HD-GYP domain-containing protein (c-di-GMP phosphodiesterase class II)
MMSAGTLASSLKGDGQILRQGCGPGDITLNEVNAMRTERRGHIIEEVKADVRLLEGLISFSVYCLLFLLIKTLYDSYLKVPTSSVAVIIALLAVLLTTVVLMSKKMSARAISNITMHTTRFNKLLDTAQDILKQTFPDTLREKILLTCMELTGADSGAIMTAQGNDLTCEVISGQVLHRYRGLTIPVDCCVTGKAATSRRIIRLNGKEVAEEAPYILTALKPRVSSMLIAPFYEGEKLAGVIELYSVSGKEFENCDEAIISYLLDLASISLQQVNDLEERRNFETHITEILLQAMDSHIPVKRAHSERVAWYSQIVAKALDFSFEQARQLHIACLLHDIGFIRFPAREEADKSVYMGHVTAAHRMLSQINCYQEVAEIILHHHERFDGTGYPRGLQGEDIPLESRIISVAEAFDAMTSKSSYQQSRSVSEALRELSQNAGGQFDPKVVEIFINAVYRDKIHVVLAEEKAEATVGMAEAVPAQIIGA